MRYPVHSIATAAPAAQPELAGAKSAYGFVPNLLGMMAEAPALLRGYRALSEAFDATSLTPAERQVVLLATSAVNGCEYCVAAHTVIAGMQKVPAPVVEAIRTGRAINEPRLEALRRFTEAVVATRGWPTSEVTAAFVAAGYGSTQVLEVVLGIGLKTLSNYANHIAETPLDSAFAPAAWSRVQTFSA